MDYKLVTSEIINILNRSGAQEFDELFKTISKTHNELDVIIFNKYLMELEIQGLLRVLRMTRGKRRIELL